jgi:hypothetical protein
MLDPDQRVERSWRYDFCSMIVVHSLWNEMLSVSKKVQSSLETRNQWQLHKVGTTKL